MRRIVLTCSLQVQEFHTLLNLWWNDQLFAHLPGASQGVISRNPRKQTEWYPSRKIGALSQGDNNPAVERGIIYIFYLAECIIQKSNWRSDPEYIIQRDIIFSGLRLSGNNTWITNTPQPSRNGCVLSGLKMKRIEKFYGEFLELCSINVCLPSKFTEIVKTSAQRLIINCRPQIRRTFAEPLVIISHDRISQQYWPQLENPANGRS